LDRSLDVFATYNIRLQFTVSGATATHCSSSSLEHTPLVFGLRLPLSGTEASISTSSGANWPEELTVSLQLQLLLQSLWTNSSVSLELALTVSLCTSLTYGASRALRSKHQLLQFMQCVNKSVSTAAPYSLPRERYLRHVPSETRHNMLWARTLSKWRKNIKCHPVSIIWVMTLSKCPKKSRKYCRINKICSCGWRVPVHVVGETFKNLHAWNGVHSTLVRINKELQKTEINGRGCSAALTTRHPSIHKSWH
jgi:hypothetical protein